MNKQIITGRMVRDAEPFGNPEVGVRFAIATEDYDFSTKKNETEFHECVAFGKVTDVIKNYAGKGRWVEVEGKTRTNAYTPSKGIHAGHEVKEKRVIVDSFKLGPGTGSSTGGGTASGGGDDGPPLW